jgi:hypothetical protein
MYAFSEHRDGDATPARLSPSVQRIGQPNVDISTTVAAVDPHSSTRGI